VENENVSKKEQVTCFYCDGNGQKDKANDHCKKQHPDKAFKLKTAENNMEIFFQKQIHRDAAATSHVTNAEEQGEEEPISLI